MRSVGVLFTCAERVAGVEYTVARLMSAPETAEGMGTRYTSRVWGQVLLAVILVPLGILGGWYALSPTPETLAGRAAGGGDSRALLELVRIARQQPQAARALEQLLGADAAALHSLAALAAGHEDALMCLIELARTQPAALRFLSDLEMSHAFALEVLRHIQPSGISELEKYAASRANACFMLGVAYECGCHVPLDMAQSAFWYARALKSGYEAAGVHCGNAAYQAALGLYEIPGREQEAASWFRMAADLNHAAAQCALGVCYAAGAGVEIDLECAVAWYRRAAEQGNSDAQFNLGWCCLHGEGVAVDAARAAEWFRLAASQGDDLAQYYLGRACELGQGVRQDSREAVYWYRWAVEQGNAAAQCALGHCYAQGVGVAQDWSQAVAWYRLAADQGRTEAMQALAHCYEHGLGVPADAAAAARWRALAEQSQQTQ